MVEKFTVEIANMTGHSVVEMTREEIQETAKKAGAWVFVDNTLVSATEIAEVELNQDTSLRVLPELSADSEELQGLINGQIQKRSSTGLDIEGVQHDGIS